LSRGGDGFAIRTDKSVVQRLAGEVAPRSALQVCICRELGRAVVSLCQGPPGSNQKMTEDVEKSPDCTISPVRRGRFAVFRSKPRRDTSISPG